jgi:hypothetical protein
MAEAKNDVNFVETVLIVKSCEKTTAEVLDELKQKEDKNKSLDELLKKGA